MVPGYSGNCACKKYISGNVRLSIRCNVGLAVHTCKRVIAIGVRVERVMPLEKGSICKSNRFEIFLTKHFKQNFDLVLDLLVDCSTYLD